MRSVSAGCAVKEVTTQKDGTVTLSLADKKSLTAKAVVVATEGPAALRLLGKALEAAPSKEQNGVGTCCLYFRCTLLHTKGFNSTSRVHSGRQGRTVVIRFMSVMLERSGPGCRDVSETQMENPSDEWQESEGMAAAAFSRSSSH